MKRALFRSLQPEPVFITGAALKNLFIALFKPPPYHAQQGHPQPEEQRG